MTNTTPITTLKEINDLPLGGSLIYHEGLLARDRQTNEAVDIVASDLYKRSTLRFSINPSEIETPIPGTGEFELFQIKKDNAFKLFTEIDDDGVEQQVMKKVLCYEYRARRIKMEKK